MLEIYKTDGFELSSDDELKDEEKKFRSSKIKQLEVLIQSDLHYQQVKKEQESNKAAIQLQLKGLNENFSDVIKRGFHPGGKSIETPTNRFTNQFLQHAPITVPKIKFQNDT
jgi:hypothetical protein